MAEPGTGEAHQLLTSHGHGRQHRRDLDVLNQQTIQKSQDQDAENPQAELEQTQTQSKSQPAQGRITKSSGKYHWISKKSIVICSPRLPPKPGSTPACA